MMRTMHGQVSGVRILTPHGPLQHNKHMAGSTDPSAVVWAHACMHVVCVCVCVGVRARVCVCPCAADVPENRSEAAQLEAAARAYVSLSVQEGSCQCSKSDLSSVPSDPTVRAPHSPCLFCVRTRCYLGAVFSTCLAMKIQLSMHAHTRFCLVTPAITQK